MNKSPITTHVLDVSIGKPAVAVHYALEYKTNDTWSTLSVGATDNDGRVQNLCSSPLKEGIYRITFETNEYFQAKGLKSFYPAVNITFEITNKDEHYHVPLLLSPFGYSTYRGS